MSGEVAVHWRCCAFDELSVRELDAIYRGRQQVFSVEQNCVYLDADGVDPHCWQLAAWRGGDHALLAHARLVPPGVKYAEPSIGRVITTAAARGSGLGQVLIARAVAEVERLWPGRGIRISAQSYLRRFYGEAGFVAVTDDYDEDGIPHVEMLRAPAGAVTS
jgi:ElaA protein